jgi:hypothetical protein
MSAAAKRSPGREREREGRWKTRKVAVQGDKESGRVG